MRTFLHSCAQRLGLQRLSSTIAMRVILSAMMTDEKYQHVDRRRRTRFSAKALDSTLFVFIGSACPRNQIGIYTTWLPSVGLNPVHPIGLGNPPACVNVKALILAAYKAIPSLSFPVITTTD
jgi:hypothetical protein